MSLGDARQVLYGARIATYSPHTQTGTVWLYGEPHAFHMAGCRVARGRHTTVRLSSKQDTREPKPRSQGDPGERIVIHRRNNQIVAWGYRPAPNVHKILSPQLLVPHVGCSFVYYDRPRMDRSAQPHIIAEGKIRRIRSKAPQLIIEYVDPALPRQVQTQNVRIEVGASFEDLRGEPWGPVGRLVIEMEDAFFVKILVLSER